MASGSVISLGIQVDGEKTFNSAISAIDAQIKSFGAGIDAATASMDKMGSNEEATAKKTELLAKTVEANEQKLKILNQQYENAQARLEELGKALDAAKASGDPSAIDKATNAYNSQAKTVANLSTKISTTEKAQADAMRAMEGGANAAAQEAAAMERTGKQSDELTQAVQRMSTMMSVEFVGKAAGMVVDGFKMIIDSAVQAGTYIFDLTTEAGKYADTMLTLADTSNVDVINLQKWEYASQFIDTEVSTITGSLTKLTKNMTSESAATSAAFETLGISVRDSSGNLKDAETVMWEAIDALGNVENQTERDSLAMTLFGKSASDLNPLIKAGSEAFKALGDEAESAGLILSEDAMGALGGVDDAMNRVNSTISGLKNTVAVMFAPAITELTDGFSAVVQAGIEMVNGTEGSEEKFLAAIGNLTDTAIRLLNDMLPVILETGVKIIVNLVTGISNNIEKITSTITSVIRELLSTITKHLPQILRAGVDILISVIDGIIQAIPDLVAMLPQIIEAIVSGLAKLAPRLWQAGIDIVVGLWHGIKERIVWLWEQIKEALGSVFGWVLDLLGIHSPSTVMRDKVGKMLVLGMAEGITGSADKIQQAFDDAMPSPEEIVASVDNVSVAARVTGRAAAGSGPLPWQDNRPIILRLNDRELGRAVRGYARGYA